MRKPTTVIERNTLIKRWDRVELKICLCSPVPYEASVLNLALQIIYSMWNMREDVLCERAFPNVYDGVLSLETKHKLSEFDVLAFSLQYETDLINVINMLKRNKLLGKRRDNRPLLIAGGPVIMQNPRPFSSVFDALFIGEIEEVSDKFLDSLKNSLEERSLDSMLDVPCVYMPSVEERYAKRCYVKNLDECFYPTAQFYPEGIRVAFGPSFLLEISRGCSYNCRFCLARSIYMPLRLRSLKRVEEILDQGLKSTKLNRVSVISFAAADHPRLVDVLESIVSRGLKFTLPSVRVDKVPLEVLTLLRKVGQRSVTIAPEVASDRLASIIRKGIYPEDVIRLARELFKVGFRKVKLYFMIGLPGENEKDVIQIPQLIEDIVKVGFFRVSVTVNPLIPKPHTPFQWLPFIKKEEFEERRKIIINGIRHKNVVKLSFLNWSEGVIQVVIARGESDIGRRLARVEGLLSKRKTWIEILRYLRERPKVFHGFSIDDRLPWEVVDVRISKKFLVAEFEDFHRNLR